MSNLVNGKSGITAKTALLLSKVFNNSPRFWMYLQSNYELTKVMQSGRRAAVRK